MSQNDKIASELKAQFNKMRRGVKDVVISQSGKITVFCKSKAGAMSVKIDLLRIGRKNAIITNPGPFTMGCFLVEC